MILTDALILTGISTTVTIAGILIHHLFNKRQLTATLKDPLATVRQMNEEVQAMKGSLRVVASDLGFHRGQEHGEIVRGFHRLETIIKGIKK
jgi:hypothetical protein